MLWILCFIQFGTHLCYDIISCHTFTLTDKEQLSEEHIDKRIVIKVGEIQL